MTRMYPDVCKHCGGKGKIAPSISTGTTTAPVDEVCPVCKGTGVITVTEFSPDPVPCMPYNPYPLYQWGQPIVHC